MPDIKTVADIKDHYQEMYIWHSGNKYPKDELMEELKNIFAASCVEAVARKLGCSTGEMYRRMKEVNLFRDFIYPCYGTLHTQSRQIVTEDVIAALKIRQERLTAL